MGVCPKCGSPISDTDFACRQCGMSFVADPSTLSAGSYTAAGAYDPNSPNFAVAPGAFARPAGECPEASSALWLALGGMFCFGFAFGSMAIRNALKARQKIQMHPGMTGGAKATAALWLGVLDVIGWGYWMLTYFGRHHH